MNGAFLKRLRAIVLKPKAVAHQVSQVTRRVPAKQLNSRFAGLDMLIQQKKRELSTMSRVRRVTT